MSQENRATPPAKGPVAPTFATLKGGVALQVTSWKVSRYRGLHCRLSRWPVGGLRIFHARPVGGTKNAWKIGEHP